MHALFYSHIYWSIRFNRYVLEYIGLHPDYSTNNFAIMDIFRFYDLNLDGINNWLNIFIP